MRLAGGTTATQGRPAFALFHTHTLVRRAGRQKMAKKKAPWRVLSSVIAV
jgi:hypothetical protein